MKIEAVDPKDFNKFIEVKPIVNMPEEMIDDNDVEVMKKLIKKLSRLAFLLGLVIGIDLVLFLQILLDNLR